MAIEIRHREHTYIYRHPLGWSGGDEILREKLNESLPAGEYPAGEAEALAVRHALAGILAGGTVIALESGRQVRQVSLEPESQDASTSPPSARPDLILEETGDAGTPDRILQDRGEDYSSGSFTGDPERILED